MTLEFLPEATVELYEAVGYYESRQVDLGKRLRDEVFGVCSSISRQPFLWREQPGGYRRVNCPVFPYYVAYFIRGDGILVAAIAHGHRRPGYWKKRLS